MVRSADNPDKKTQRRKNGKDHRPAEASVGDALRRVYSEAVQEQIPDEMLDLLNKLD